MFTSARARSISLFLLGFLLASCGGSERDEGTAIGVASGFNVVDYQHGERRMAPSFEGERLGSSASGRPARVDGSVLAGKVGVVNFWGSWCGPCRREQGALEALWKEYGPRGVQFVGINTRRDQRAAAEAFLREFSVTYPSIYNPDSRIAFAFRVRTMPASFVIDREGRIAAMIVGALRSEADLRRLLDRELAA